MIRKIITGCAALLCVVMLNSARAEELKSGLQSGESVPPFHVKDVTGKSAGKSLCYRCQFGDRPVVNVFVRDTNCDSFKKLAKKLDEQLQGDKEMRGFVVVLTEDAEGTEKSLKEMAEKEGLKKLPLTMFSGKAGPEGYKIAADAHITVMMWKDSKIVANHAFKAENFKPESVDKIVEDLAKLKS